MDRPPLEQWLERWINPGLRRPTDGDAVTVAEYAIALEARIAALDEALSRASFDGLATANRLIATIEAMESDREAFAREVVMEICISPLRNSTIDGQVSAAIAAVKARRGEALDARADEVAKP